MKELFGKRNIRKDNTEGKVRGASTPAAELGAAIAWHLGCPPGQATLSAGAPPSAVQLVVLPPVEQLQTDPATKSNWVKYSATDAKSTWDLYTALREKLEEMRDIEVDPDVNAEYEEVRCRDAGQGPLPGGRRRGCLCLGRQGNPGC